MSYTYRLNLDGNTDDSYNIKNFEIIKISRLFLYFLKNRCSGNSRIADFPGI